MHRYEKFDDDHEDIELNTFNFRNVRHQGRSIINSRNCLPRCLRLTLEYPTNLFTTIQENISSFQLSKLNKSSQIITEQPIQSIVPKSRYKIILKYPKRFKCGSCKCGAGLIYIEGKKHLSTHCVIDLHKRGQIPPYVQVFYVL